MAAVAEKKARVDLDLEGMTCASCAARIERRLNKLEGVAATVNFATERAAVRYDPGRVDVAALIDAVEATGYQASLPRAEKGHTNESAPLRWRLTLSVVLTAPLVVVSMAGAA